MKDTGKINRYLTDGLFYLLGSILYALSVIIFTAPNNIAPGGLTGVGTIINYLFKLPIGTVIFVMNIPLLIAAWRHLGLGFTIRTTIATTMVSVIIDVGTPFIPVFHGNMILTVLFGGVLSGIGLGLIYLRGATTGGSEVAARLLELKFRHISIGQLILLVDAAVVIISAIVYKNIENALYAIISIYVSSSLMDTLIYGRRKGKMLLIITQKDEEITQEILRTVQRGVTILKAVGAYTGKDKHVLLCAVRPSEVYVLRTLIYDRDPQAFIMVTSTDEVLGEGFMLPK